jgi:glycosyltransferase involved in cell wall biosynthesis
MSEPIAGSVLVTIGEDPAHERAMEDGRRPFGEAPFLRRAFSTTCTMRDFAPARLGSLVAQARFAFDVARKLRRRAHRLVYLSEELPGIFVLGALVATGDRSKKVMLVHNVGSRLRSIPLGTMKLARALDRVLVLSESSRRIVVTRWGVDPAKVVVLGSRVDETFFAPRAGAATKERPLVVSAGAINRDYATLVEACRDLDVDVKIAADTGWAYSEEQRQRVGAKRSTAALTHPRLEMRSWGTYEALRDLYGDADVVVVPLYDTEYASGQTVILEAMALGKPVVTSDIRGRSDFVVDGVNGLYVKPEDPAALRAAIERVLADPAAARAMGGRAARDVRARFTVDAYVDRILGACRAALGEATTTATREARAAEVAA